MFPHPYGVLSELPCILFLEIPYAEIHNSPEPNCQYQYCLPYPARRSAPPQNIVMLFSAYVFLVVFPLVWTRCIRQSLGCTRLFFGRGFLTHTESLFLIAESSGSNDLIPVVIYQQIEGAYPDVAKTAKESLHLCREWSIYAHDLCNIYSPNFTHPFCYVGRPKQCKTICGLSCIIPYFTWSNSLLNGVPFSH